MIDPLTDEEIATLTRLERERTQGEWTVKDDGYNQPYIVANDGPLIVDVASTDTVRNGFANAAYLAAAANAVPRLLAVLAAQKERAKEAIANSNDMALALFDARQERDALRKEQFEGHGGIPCATSAQLMRDNIGYAVQALRERDEARAEIAGLRSELAVQTNRAEHAEAKADELTSMVTAAELRADQCAPRLAELRAEVARLYNGGESLGAMVRQLQADLRECREVHDRATQYGEAWRAYDEASDEAERTQGYRRGDYDDTTKERLSALAHERSAAHVALLRAMGIEDK